MSGRKYDDDSDYDSTSEEEMENKDENKRNEVSRNLITGANPSFAPQYVQLLSPDNQMPEQSILSWKDYVIEDETQQPELRELSPVRPFLEMEQNKEAQLQKQQLQTELVEELQEREEAQPLFELKIQFQPQQQHQQTQTEHRSDEHLAELSKDFQQDSQTQAQPQQQHQQTQTEFKKNQRKRRKQNQKNIAPVHKAVDKAAAYNGSWQSKRAKLSTSDSASIAPSAVLGKRRSSVKKKKPTRISAAQKQNPTNIAAVNETNNSNEMRPLTSNAAPAGPTAVLGTRQSSAKKEDNEKPTTSSAALEGNPTDIAAVHRAVHEAKKANKVEPSTSNAAPTTSTAALGAQQLTTSAVLERNPTNINEVHRAVNEVNNCNRVKPLTSNAAPITSTASLGAQQPSTNKDANEKQTKSAAVPKRNPTDIAALHRGNDDTVLRPLYYNDPTLRVRITPIDPVVEENDEEWVTLGYYGTRIRSYIYRDIRWELAPAVRDLLYAVFDTETLATHSRTGRPTPAQRRNNTPCKPPLNPFHVADIVEIVGKMCKVEDRKVDAKITDQLQHEHKYMMRRKREMEKEKEKDKEKDKENKKKK